MAKRRLLLLDANAILHRSFHALPPLSTKQGVLVNAVYGFVTTLLKAIREFKPTHIAAAFDKRGPTFRHEEYQPYKATRVKAPQEFYDQIPMVHDLLKAFHIPVYELDRYEADDVIGTVTKRTSGEGVEAIIATGDLDALQLVDDRTKVFTLRKGLTDTIVYDEATVKDRYGLKPEQMIDYKGLAGDASDNIPGVKGIGEKTAVDLLKTFGSIEELYEALERDTPKAKQLKEGVKSKLLASKKDAFLSKKLATIVRDAPVKFSLDEAVVRGYDKDAVFKLFQQFEFKSLLNRLPELQGKLDLGYAKAKTEASSKSRTKSDGHYQLVDTDERFAAFFKKLSAQKSFAVDTETTSLQPHDAKLLGVSFSWEEGRAFYVDTRNAPERLKRLKAILEDPNVQKFGHNLKYDYAVLKLAGVELAPLAFDSMIASYLLNSGTRAHKLDDLAFAEFGHQMIPIEQLIGKGKKQRSMAEVDRNELAEYSGEDADYTFRLVGRFRKQLEKGNIAGLFEKMEMPLVPVLATLELNGVKIDVDHLNTLKKELSAKLRHLETQIHKHAGGEFNIASPIQLKEVLFGKLKLSMEGIGKTKTGLSTAADQLEKLRGKHPIIELILEYREFSKLLSTYIEALPELVNEKTGRVHTDFNQTVAATGRLSSSNPNLQNIPIRTNLGREIRKAFVAPRGYRLISADYSQIELRIIASLANDEKMIAAFKKGEDVHKRTAAEVFDVLIEEVTHDQRYAAKEVNFGILYGMGAVGLAQRKGITREAAHAFIEKYFLVHSAIAQYLTETKALAHKLGYVETLFGRRRSLPEINSSMPQVRSGAERMAVNLPVQGTAADLLKLAMIAVHEKLPSISPESKMILTVHDELVFEVPDTEVKRVGHAVKEIMDSVYKLKVPIETEVKVGKNWGDMTVLEHS